MLPIPPFKTNRDVADHLWVSRHGPTGFRCPCGSLHAYLRDEDARSKICKVCGAEIFVTADTLMRGTRLPLLAWVHVLECRERIPTARALAARFGVAVSSAWHLLQRTLRWAELRTVEAAQHTEVARIALRAAAAPMVPGAPAHILGLDAAGAAAVAVQLDLAGDRAWCGPIGVAVPDSGSHRVWDWLAERLRERGHVSLRWLPRWIAAFLGLWGRANGEAAPAWSDVVRGVAPIPLRRLCPWQA